VDAQRIVRVPQPPDQSSNAGYRAAAANRGRLFFGYFILAKQKKVTSCRATPGGFGFGFEFGFDSDVGLRGETANPTYKLVDATPQCGATLRYFRANGLIIF